MNPYAPPGGPADPGMRPRGGDYHARLDGDVLVVGREARLPSVCLKCASHQDIVHRPSKFQWTPSWARFLVFCGIGIVIMLLMTKRAELAVPLCPPCNARWSAARNVLIAGTVLLVLSVVGLRLGDDPGAMLPLVGVVLVAFVIVALVYVKPRMLQVRKIDDQVVELKGCHPGAAQEIAEGSAI
jgi:hypothetical protein